MAIVYDPGAVDVDAAFWMNVPDSFENAVAVGRVVHLTSAAEDVRFRVFVDEPLGAELETFARWRSEGLLRVPTGRLVATGAHRREHDAPGCALPHGNYDVTGIEIDWRGTNTDAANVAARNASRLGAALEPWIGTLTGMIVFPALFVLLTILVNVVLGSWAFVLQIVPWFLALLAALIAVWRWGPIARAMRAREAALATFPTNALVLRRLPDDADVTARRGCTIGHEPADAREDDD